MSHKKQIKDTERDLGSTQKSFTAYSQDCG